MILSYTNATSLIQTTRIFTQNIENTWQQAKRKLKRQYANQRYFFPPIWQNFFGGIRWEMRMFLANYYPKYYPTILRSMFYIAYFDKTIFG